MAPRDIWDANPLFQNNFWYPYIELYEEIMQQPHVQTIEESEISRVGDLDDSSDDDDDSLDDLDREALGQSDPRRYQFVVFEDEDEEEEEDEVDGMDARRLAEMERFLHGLGGGSGTVDDPIDLTSF